MQIINYIIFKMENQHIKIANISAPGKAILCGQHSVVYGQDAIAFAINLKCKLELFRIIDNSKAQREIRLQINMNNQLYKILFVGQIYKKAKSITKFNGIRHINNFKINQVQIDLSQFCLELKSSNLLHEHKQLKQNCQNFIVLQIVYKIVLFFSIFDLNFKNNGDSFDDFFIQDNHKEQNKINYLIKTSSEIPIGKGLGSSAAFNSVLASSLFCIVFNSLFSSTQSPKSLQNQSKNSYRELLNYISQVFETVEHGKPSGIDNFVSIYGGLVLFNKTKSPKFMLIDNKQIIEKLQEQIRFGVVDSKIQKNTKKAVERVRQKYFSGEIKYKNMIEQIGTLSQKILSLLQSSQNDQIVINKMFDIIQLNHSHLREFGLSNLMIEQIVKAFKVQNKSSAKITGSGMGGVVLIIGKKEFMQQIKSKPRTAHEEEMIICEINVKGLQIQFI